MQVNWLGHTIQLVNETVKAGGSAWDPSGKPWGFDVLSRFCKRFERLGSELVVVDVGANTGGWTLLFATLPNVRKVYSFEPVPMMFEILQKNIQLNEFGKKVVPICKAASNRVGEIQFSLTEDPAFSHGGQKTLRTHIVGGVEVVLKHKHISVPTTTLDTILQHESHLHAIKIDIEGGELQAIQGAEKVLRQHYPDILYEHCIRNTLQFDYKPEQIVELLKSFGYNDFENWGAYEPGSVCFDCLARKV